MGIWSTAIEAMTRPPPNVADPILQKRLRFIQKFGYCTGSFMTLLGVVLAVFKIDIYENLVRSCFTMGPLTLIGVLSFRTQYWLEIGRMCPWVYTSMILVFIIVPSLMAVVLTVFRGVPLLQQGRYMDYVLDQYQSYLYAAFMPFYMLTPGTVAANSAVVILSSAAAFVSNTFDDPSAVMWVCVRTVWGFLTVSLVFTSFVYFQRFDRARYEDAKNRADDMSRAKSQFVATVSHEIRTPLNGVIGMTNLLLESNLSSSQREWARNVATASRVLLALANQVLDFAKLEADRLELLDAPFDLRSICEDVLQVCSATAKKDVELLTQFAPTLPTTVIGDATRLQQILVNLISNSCKFTTQGEVVLSVTTQEPMDNLLPVTLSVRDTGCGLSEEQQNRLFTPFMQADNVSSRKHGGVGLGLVIAQRIAKIMGGGISVSSELGRGSVFTVNVVLQMIPGSKSLEDDQRLRSQRLAVLCRSRFAERTYVQNLSQSGADTMVGLEKSSVIESCTGIVVDIEQLHVVKSLLKREHRCGVVVIAPHTTSSFEFADNVRQPVRVVHRPVRNESLILAVNEVIQEVTKDEWLRPSHMPRNRSVDTNLLVSDSPSSPGGYSISPSFRSSLPPSSTPSRSPSFRSAHLPSRGGSFRSTDASPNSIFTVPISIFSMGPRVLVAEDYDMNQTVIRILLEKLGCDVTIANDGQEAVEMVEKAIVPFDIVLMDVHMPRMDGYEATKKIRAMEAERSLKSNVPLHMPVIAVTASALKEEQEECLNIGMDDFLAKPIALDALKQILSKYTPLELL